jgi:hypothetical protein
VNLEQISGKGTSFDGKHVLLHLGPKLTKLTTSGYSWGKARDRGVHFTAKNSPKLRILNIKRLLTNQSLRSLYDSFTQLGTHRESSMLLSCNACYTTVYLHHTL